MKKHPNRMPFRGVLTILDAPADRPPAGARGHRVVLSRAAAEAALSSLIGMAVDFTAGFDGHDARRKVGIITSAEIASGTDVAAAFTHPERSEGALLPGYRAGRAPSSRFALARDVKTRKDHRRRSCVPERLCLG
jgi:hypothetical protein